MCWWIGSLYCERPGVALSVWDRDTLGALQIDIEEAIVMKAVNTCSRRFIP